MPSPVLCSTNSDLCPAIGACLQCRKQIEGQCKICFPTLMGQDLMGQESMDQAIASTLTGKGQLRPWVARSRMFVIQGQSDGGLIAFAIPRRAACRRIAAVPSSVAGPKQSCSGV